MQMGNILENVWGLLCFYAAQLLVNVSWYDVNFVQYKHYKSASAKARKQPANMFLCRQTRKINPAKLTAFTVTNFSLIAFQLWYNFWKILHPQSEPRLQKPWVYSSASNESSHMTRYIIRWQHLRSHDRCSTSSSVTCLALGSMCIHCTCTYVEVHDVLKYKNWHWDCALPTLSTWNIWNYNKNSASFTQKLLFLYIDCQIA